MKVKTSFLILVLSTTYTAMVVAEQRVVRSQCESCHEVEYKAFKGSAHQVVGTSCHDCHGGNPDAEVKALAHSEEKDFVGKSADHVRFCGRCHEVEQKSYETSPHFGKFDENYFDLLSCSTCHEYHTVKKPDYTWFNLNCVLCHSSERKALEVGGRFFNVLKAAWEQQEAFDSSMQRLKSKGFFCSSEGKSAELVRGLIKNSQRLSHSLKVEDLLRLQEETQGMNQEIDAGLSWKASYFQRTMSALVVGWFLFAVVGVVIWKMIRRL
ncbi:MAG: hypothetical protein O2857_08295 [Planctomycetota bacterium]|nr:hypothetical protein [Planctomycetota bacterium]